MKQDINRYEILEKITPLIENTAVRFNLIPIEIEFIKENHKWFLRIYLYSYEKDITLDDCENVTRSLNDFLDELIPVKYYLEVSSPGLERKFKSDKEFLIFKGRRISLKLKTPLAKKAAVILGIISILRLKEKQKKFSKVKYWIGMIIQA